MLRASVECRINTAPGHAVACRPVSGILQPGPWFSSVGSEEFIERYNAEVLAPLGPAQVHELMALAGGGKIPAWSAESTSVAFAPAVVSSCLAAAWMAEAIGSRCSGTSTCRKRAPAPLIAHRRARARARTDRNRIPSEPPRRRPQILRERVYDTCRKSAGRYRCVFRSKSARHSDVMSATDSGVMSAIPI